MKLQMFLAQAADPHRMNVEERVYLGRLNLEAETYTTKAILGPMKFTLINFKDESHKDDSDAIPYTNTYIEHLHVTYEGLTFKGAVMMHANGKGLTAVGFLGKKRVYASWDSKPLSYGQLRTMMPRFFHQKVFS